MLMMPPQYVKSEVMMPALVSQIPKLEAIDAGACWPAHTERGQ